VLHYAVVFLVIALIAAFFGFGGIAAGAVSIAKLLFFVFVLMAVVAFVVSLTSSRRPCRARPPPPKKKAAMSIDTQNTLDSTRKMANQAMERASGMATRGYDAVSESALAAQRQLNEIAHRGTRYVADHPMKTALIAAAVGAAVAGIVLALRRRDSDHWF
jgi:uncharacterized membrane protein YtjA (UPF0391 family)/ElaB/YqjD/DUF883 family membrane-anchored ribosome-binding protein